MDTRNGKIYTPAEVDKILVEKPGIGQFIKPMNIPPTTKQLATGKVGRNDPCPCGSGKKFKKCCLRGRFND